MIGDDDNDPFGSKPIRPKKFFDDRGFLGNQHRDHNTDSGVYVGPYPPETLRGAVYVCERWGVLERLQKDHRRKKYEKRLEIMVSTAQILEKLARPFFSAVKIGNEKKAQSLLDAGVPINCTEPSTRFTALHYAAARKAHAVTEMLLARGGIDHLQRDGFGRLASEMAGRFGGDYDLAERLRMLEAAQAQKQGITLTYRPRSPAS